MGKKKIKKFDKEKFFIKNKKCLLCKKQFKLYTWNDNKKYCSSTCSKLWTKMKNAKETVLFTLEERKIYKRVHLLYNKQKK